MKLASNGLQFEVIDEGPRNGQPLLMIMGLGMQLTAWPDGLVQQLIARGFRVIRFDNRDIGLSSHLDEQGLPNLGLAAMLYALHLPTPQPAYMLQDMARDALGLLDALQVRECHVLGASMGGMIAQHLALLAPERVRSLGLMMTTSGGRARMMSANAMLGSDSHGRCVARKIAKATPRAMPEIDTAIARPTVIQTPAMMSGRYRAATSALKKVSRRRSTPSISGLACNARETRGCAHVSARRTRPLGTLARRWRPHP